MQEPTRESVKGLLLVALANESDQGTRHKVADTIAEVSKSDIMDGGNDSKTMKLIVLPLCRILLTSSH